MKQPVRIISTLDACTEACNLLKRAGFETVAVSRQSVATYYRLPGRGGVIRVADHPGSRKDRIGLDLVLARLTFLPHKLHKEPDTLAITETSLHNLVCAAIGRYMIRSNQEVRSTYDGPRAVATSAEPPSHNLIAVLREPLFRLIRVIDSEPPPTDYSVHLMGGRIIERT